MLPSAWSIKTMCLYAYRNKIPNEIHLNKDILKAPYYKSEICECGAKFRARSKFQKRCRKYGNRKEPRLGKLGELCQKRRANALKVTGKVKRVINAKNYR